MSICGFCIQETSTSEVLAEHWLDGDERETLIFFGAKSKEVYRELSVTGQMCTECYGIERKQTETSHPAFQSPTGLPWPASHSLWGLTLSLCSPGQLPFRLPGPHEVPLSLLSSLHLPFPLPAVALPLTFFIAGSLVLRNLNITCWEQPLPLDNAMLRGYFLAHHLIIFRFIGSSSVYLVLFPFLCPFGQSSCPVDLMS